MGCNRGCSNLDPRRYLAAVTVRQIFFNLKPGTLFSFFFFFFFFLFLFSFSFSCYFVEGFSFGMGFVSFLISMYSASPFQYLGVVPCSEGAEILCNNFHLSVIGVYYSWVANIHEIRCKICTVQQACPSKEV